MGDSRRMNIAILMPRKTVSFIIIKPHTALGRTHQGKRESQYLQQLIVGAALFQENPCTNKLARRAMLTECWLEIKVVHNTVKNFITTPYVRPIHTLECLKFQTRWRLLKMATSFVTCPWTNNLVFQWQCILRAGLFSVLLLVLAY